MLTKEKILKDLHHYNDIHKKNGFELFSLFGSYAKNSQDIFSDIDLTYKINHNIFYKDNAFAKLTKIDEIKAELQDKFHKKIDLIPANTTNPTLKRIIQEEQIII